MDEKKYWLALSTNLKIGGRSFQKLLRRFGSMKAVWQASKDDLAKSGLDIGQQEAVLKVVRDIDPDQVLAKIEKLKIKIVTLIDEVYPKSLKEIPNAPGILYIRGNVEVLSSISLAVVGSRKYTKYGELAVEKIVGPLAQKGLTIVSGLALGIDTLAHLATIRSGGKTIGVLACGLDQVYPMINTNLARKITDTGGAIISEFPLGTPALRHHFPIRNRIIAGISIGTLVIEATLDSGSLITAQAALEFNREVLAVPGSIFSESSEGPNRLIKMGAKLVTNYEDVFEALEFEKNLETSKRQEIVPDCPEEEIMLRLLKTPTTVDELIKSSKLTPALVNSTLIMLEIKDMVLNLGGGAFVIKGKLKA